MSCTGPTNVRYIINCTPTSPPPEQDWVFSNANVEGQGVFFQQTDTNVEFYGLMNTDGYIKVTLDAVNKAISIDLDPDLIAGSIPDATTAVKGKVALSNDAEAQAKSSTTKALTPSNLAAVTASTTATGLVELATSPETVTGTDTQRATTPAGVKAALDASRAIQVVSNDTGRAGATPLYVGQQLYQTDTKATYFGTSLTSGGWEGPYIRGGATNDIGNTTINFGSNTFNITGADGNYATFSSSVTFNKGVNFDIDARLQINGENVSPDRLLGTDGVGQTEFHAISNFLSTFNLSPAYSPINYTGTRAFDADTVTLPELADVVATLIGDLATAKMPQIA